MSERTKPSNSHQTLTRWIIETQRQFAPEATGELSLLLTSIQLACKSISNCCNKAGIFKLFGTTGERNKSLDEVKKLDAISNEVMINSLTFTGQTAIMVSEETERPIYVKKSLQGNYGVVFDPLDGSSNIDANISIGTIFGIYNLCDEIASENFHDEKILLKKGTELIAAGYCMYGAATLMVISIGHGVHGFTLDNAVGEFILTHPKMNIPNPGKRIYSVNEGNYSNWDPAIKRFVKECHEPTDGKGPWSHRYVGSMVSDVHRTLNYGGVFMYPADRKSPNGKLRLLYEANPMAFLVEQAGGKASTGKSRIMEYEPLQIHQRVPVILGSHWMVEKIEGLYAEEDPSD